MTDVTVIGLGLMGAALAEAIRGAGHGLTVWNRSAARAEPFAAKGVPVARDLEAAVGASPVVLVCIDNYTATEALLRPVEGQLAGRTVVQLSTGTPAEARAAAERMRELGIAYLDGAILAGPHMIGTPSAIILSSGDETAHARAAGLLSSLGNARHLGANPGAASALDLAWLCDAFGHFLAIAQAALICESEGVGVDAFAGLFPDDSMVSRYAGVVHTGDFGQRTATLAVWAEGLERIRMQGRDAGIDTGFPDLAASVFDRARAAGLGDEHVMAIVKVDFITCKLILNYNLYINILSHVNIFKLLK